MLHHHDPKVASALLAGVLPALRQAIHGAGESLAIEIADGEKVNLRHRNHARQALLFLLADFLMDCNHDHGEDHLYPPLSPAELADVDYCRQWFDDLLDGTIGDCDDDGDTEPVYTVAERPVETVAESDGLPAAPAKLIGTPAPKFIAPMENREVSDDADTLIEYAVLPFITEQFDTLSDRMAQNHAPIHIIDAAKNLTEYDIPAGRKTARRLLWESLLGWMQNDSAADGQWIGVIGI